MIWAVVDNKFTFLSYDEFAKCNIRKSTNKFQFKMDVHPNEITSREDIEAVLKI